MCVCVCVCAVVVILPLTVVIMLESVNEEVFLCILQSDVHSLTLPTAKNACNSDTVWPKAAVRFDSKLSRMDCYYLPPQLAV